MIAPMASSTALLEQLLARVENLETDLAAKDEIIRAQATRIDCLEPGNTVLPAKAHRHLEGLKAAVKGAIASSAG